MKNKNDKIINKIAHCCNLPRISFFKRCVKEDAVAAVFMFELNLFQILRPSNNMLCIECCCRVWSGAPNFYLDIRANCKNLCVGLLHLLSLFIIYFIY